MPKLTDEFGYWFSGFVDGEGCFYVSEGGEIILIIRLKESDLSTLKYIKRRLGGSTGTSRGFAWWRSSAKPESLLGLINLFDKYKLRTRKLGDYKIWREAAQLRVRGLLKGNASNKYRKLMSENRKL